MKQAIITVVVVIGLVGVCNAEMMTVRVDNSTSMQDSHVCGDGVTCSDPASNGAMTGTFNGDLGTGLIVTSSGLSSGLPEGSASRVVQGVGSASLIFTVVPDAELLEVVFSYGVLADPAPPAGFDYSSVFSITVNGEECPVSASPTVEVMLDWSLLTMQEVTLLSVLLRCVKVVTPGQEVTIVMTVSDGFMGDATITSFGLLSVVTGALEVPCSPMGGDRCLRYDEERDLCEVIACTGDSYKADMDGQYCCVPEEKDIWRTCPGSTPINEDGRQYVCCEQYAIQVLIPTGSTTCLLV